MSKPKINGTGKKEGVREMFNSIAGHYDFLNHFLSAGIDRQWRRHLIRSLSESHASNVLDIATGTADLAILAARKLHIQVVGADISEQMLRIGNAKVQQAKLDSLIKLEPGDAENLRFHDNYFDAAMVAFGVRNFENLQKGLSEILRVIRPGGNAFILEFSQPRMFPVKQFYSFYSKTVMPGAGRLISKNDGAYTYLPESVQAFPDGEAFLKEMSKAGFVNLREERMTFGIASLYIGQKP